MALQSSGQIRMSELAAEFGDTGQYNLSSYYKGGALVASTEANTNVPTSGQIKLSNFYGASAASTVSMPADFSQIVTNNFTPPPEQTTTVSVRFETDGDIFTLGTNYDTAPSIGDRGDWLSDVSGLPGDAGNYEIYATLISEGWNPDTGTTGSTTGTFNTWLALSTDRTWTASATAGGDAQWQAVIQFQIREIANTANTDTIQVTLESRLVSIA